MELLVEIEIEDPPTTMVEPEGDTLELSVVKEDDEGGEDDEETTSLELGEEGQTSEERIGGKMRQRTHLVWKKKLEVGTEEDTGSDVLNEGDAVVSLMENSRESAKKAKLTRKRRWPKKKRLRSLT